MRQNLNLLMTLVARPMLLLWLKLVMFDPLLHKIQAELIKLELLPAEVAQSILTERPVLQNKLKLNKLLFLEAKAKSLNRKALRLFNKHNLFKLRPITNINIEMRVMYKVLVKNLHKL